MIKKQMMDFSNYAQLPADKVKAACVKYLDERKERIDREREELIARYMEPRFFGLFKRTREQAIEYAKNDEILISSWQMVECRGAGIAKDVYDLGTLAKTAIEQQLNDKTPTVLVNAEMATVLAGYIEEAQ